MQVIYVQGENIYLVSELFWLQRVSFGPMVDRVQWEICGIDSGSERRCEQWKDRD